MLPINLHGIVLRYGCNFTFTLHAVNTFSFSTLWQCLKFFVAVNLNWPPKHPLTAQGCNLCPNFQGYKNI